MLIGYARVSTQDQNPQLQLDALKAAGCGRVFVERASGAQRDRPELRAALGYMRSGDTLVVWKLDRLARSLKQLIETIEALDADKIGFRSLTEAIDTTTAGGRLVFQIFGALAEFERQVIRERTMAGLDAARARGRKGGRPLPFSRKISPPPKRCCAIRRSPPPRSPDAWAWSPRPCTGICPKRVAQRPNRVRDLRCRSVPSLSGAAVDNVVASKPPRTFSS
jgi:DNA invertase Pin-like site-specific DNA recombinase